MIPGKGVGVDGPLGIGGAVGEAVGVGVETGAVVGVAVGDGVGDGVGVSVAVAVGEAVAVAVDVRVGGEDGVAVGAGVDAGVGDVEEPDGRDVGEGVARERGDVGLAPPGRSRPRVTSSRFPFASTLRIITRGLVRSKTRGS